MDTKNVLLAVILSTIVLIFWATFFEAPIMEQTIEENQISKKTNAIKPVHLYGQSCNMDKIYKIAKKELFDLH